MKIIVNNIYYILISDRDEGMVYHFDHRLSILWILAQTLQQKVFDLLTQTHLLRKIDLLINYLL